MKKSMLPENNNDSKEEVTPFLDEENNPSTTTVSVAVAANDQHSEEGIELPDRRRDNRLSRPPPLLLFSSTSSSSILLPPQIRVILNSYPNIEWILFFIIMFIGLAILHSFLRVIYAIHYPLGIAYLVILHERLDNRSNNNQYNWYYRNHKFIQCIDNNEIQCIGYLFLIIMIYAIDNEIHGEVLNWILDFPHHTEQEQQNQHHTWYSLIWGIFVLLIILLFMIFSSLSVVVISSRRVFVLVRHIRTMQPGWDRTVNVIKSVVIISLSISLLVISQQQSTKGEYHGGPPLGGFLWGTCDACLLISSFVAIYEGITKNLLNNNNNKNSTINTTAAATVAGSTSPKSSSSLSPSSK